MTVNTCLVCGVAGKGEGKGIHKKCLDAYIVLKAQDVEVTQEDMEAEITNCGWEPADVTPTNWQEFDSFDELEITQLKVRRA